MRWKLPMLMVCVALMWSAPVVAQTPDSTEKDGQLNAVKGLSVDEEDDGTYIRIQGSEVATFSVFKLDEPPRLFVDLSNSELADGELSQDVYNGVISEVGLVEYEDGFQDATRLVVGFEEPAHYDVSTDGEDVVVFIDGEQRSSGSDAVAARQEAAEHQAHLQETQEQLQEVEQRYETEVEQRRDDYQQAVDELEATEDELEEARRQLAAMEQQHEDAAGSEREQLEESIADQTRKLEQAQQKLDDRQQAVDDLEESIASLKDERDAARDDARRAERRAEQAQQRADEAERSKRQAQRQADEARDSEQQAYQKVEELERRLQQMDDDVDSAEETLAEQRRQFEEAQQRAAQLEEELEQARSQGEQETVEEVEAERQRWRDLQDERQQQLDEAQAEADELEEERQQWQDRYQQGQQQLEQARQQAREAEQERDELAEQAERERKKLEQALTEKDEEIEQLRTEELAQRDEEIERLKEEARQVDPDAPRARAMPVDADGQNTVQAVRLKTDKNGRSQIVVDLDRPGDFETGVAEENGRSVMVLNDVELPEELEQTLASDADGGAVRFVSSYEAHDGSVRMEADVQEDSSEVIRQEGNRVVWEFAPGVAHQNQHAASDDGTNSRPGGVEEPVGGHGHQAGADERPTEGDSVTSAPPNYPRVVTSPTEVSSVPGMGTRPITIDLRNADIENVLRLIASESNVNIVLGDEVSGEVTMKLQQVSLDEAFLTILQSLRLGFEVRGNVIRVAPQSVLAEEEQARAEARARAQEVEPLEVFLLPINYASASELTPQVEGLLSPRGSVSVDDRTNTLIITDLPGNLESIRMLVETLDAQVPQVLIEARIVETNENFDREVGIQWGGDFGMSQGAGNPTGLVFPNVLGVSGGATDGEAPVEGTSENPNYAVNLPATAGTGQGGAMGLTMGSVGGSVNLNMRLSAMEDAGYAKIVSSPRILTLDNREATISQGTSIPISVVSAAGVQTIFVDATLELTVTPHVTPDGNVRMSIEATKNEPDFQNTGARGDPTIIQNQAETELLVDDGDTTVIGGIYTENTGESISAVPFLHRIPILGFLFRSHSETENRSELLIFITPRIVNRAEALGVMSTGTLEGEIPTTNDGQE